MDEIVTGASKRSLIEFYLQKVSSGHDDYLSSLCAQLGERLLSIPVISTQVTGDNVQNVKIIVLNEGLRTFVPVFTSVTLLKEWAGTRNTQASVVSLLGADVCLAIDPEHWLIVNPLSKNEVILPPHSIKKIAESGDNSATLVFGSEKDFDPDTSQEVESRAVVEEQPVLLTPMPPEDLSVDSIVDVMNTEIEDNIVNDKVMATPLQSEFSVDLNKADPQKDIFLDIIKSGTSTDLRVPGANSRSGPSGVDITGSQILSSAGLKYEREKEPPKKSFLKFLKTGK